MHLGNVGNKVAQIDNTNIAAMSSIETIKLFVPENIADSFLNFGEKIAISGSGDTIAIGCYSFRDFKGAVLIYNRRSFAKDYALELVISHPDLIPGNYFGSSVSISDDGTVLLIGAPGFNCNAGAIFVYRKTPKGWEFYNRIIEEEKKLNFFGTNSCISGDGKTIVASSLPIESNIGGVIRVYKYDNFNNTWTYASSNSNPSMRNFGLSLATDFLGENIIVGAPSDSNDKHILTDYRVCKDNKTYAEAQLLISPKVPIPGAFATSLSISGDGQILISNRISLENDSAVIGYYKHGLWKLGHVFCPEYVTHSGKPDAFGAHVDISRDGTTVAATAPKFTTEADDANGSVIILKTNKFNFKQYKQFFNEFDANIDIFGITAKLNRDGTVCAIGHRMSRDAKSFVTVIHMN